MHYVSSNLTSPVLVKINFITQLISWDFYGGNMNTISFLAIACICIELWHLVYYIFLYDKYFKYTSSIVKLAKNYDNFYNSFIEFSEGYTNHQELQSELKISYFLLNISNSLSNLDAENIHRHKILSVCPMKQLVLLLLQQFIEIAYRIILTILAIFSFIIL